MPFILPVANLITIIIENWQLSCAVLAVFASLMLGLFKGVKHGVRLFIVLFIIACAYVSACIVFYFVNNDIDGLINFAIAWGPTIVFVTIIFFSTLIGIGRGLRKSLILFTHSLVIAGVCISAFLFCATSPAVDKFALDAINFFMGESGLQNALGVSAQCPTVRAVFLELVGEMSVDWGDFGILLRDNSAYVLSIVDMGFRIALALIFYVIYLLLSGIMYFVYLIFYPERKYRKKKNLRFAKAETDCSYKKRPVGGGCVGAVRGMISGVLLFSLIGSVLFIVVGGSGASKLPEISFGKDYDPIVSIYRSIENYGEQGIFKVLNSISDTDDTPYYLFAADLVLSGGLDDEDHAVSGNVKFRDELAAYMGFAKDTLALLMKYDRDGEIAEILQGNADDKAMDKILAVCTDPQFKVEFDNLIDNFDSKTYIINFALSLVDSVIANVDNLEFANKISHDNKELLQLLFKSDYYCPVIPDERSGIINETPPHLTINHLFTKKDARIVLNTVLSIIGGTVDLEEPVTLARTLIPYIEELSILSSERSNEMDPVLGRLYCYLENKYLTDDGEDGITYAEIKNEPVRWTSEIRALLSISDGLLTMYDKVQGEDVFDNLLSLFDKSNVAYSENVEIYEELTGVVCDSALLSKVLCSKKISRILHEQFMLIDEDVYFPAKLTYENKYDKDGKLISHGEAYQLLRGLRLLAEDNRQLLEYLIDGTMPFDELLKELSKTITNDDPNAHGNSLASYLTESVLLRSALSSVIITRAGDMLVVPSLSFDANTNGRLINKVELREIFEAVPELTELLLPLAEEDFTATDINNILEDKTFNGLLENGNKIVEGTIAKAMVDMFSNNNTIIISKKLENFEEWVTVGTPGELRKFLKMIDILEIDIEALMDGGSLDGTEIFDKIKLLDGKSIDELIASDVFYYSASKMLDEGEFGFEGFEVIVPKSACINLTDDKLKRLIKKDELASVFIELNQFGLTSDMESESIVRKLVEQKDVLNKNNIISATVVNFIVGNRDICSSLGIPEIYIAAGSGDRLEDYDSTNAWHSELPDLVTAVDEIFGISNGDDFTFDEATVTDKTNALLSSFDDIASTNVNLTRLEVCCASEIIRSRITEEIDNSLVDRIEVEVQTAIKQGREAYSQIEISALMNAVREFGITDFGDFENLDFRAEINGLLDKSIHSENKTKLDVIYFSDIAVGVITKTVKDAFAESGTGLVYHASANRSDMAVIKQQELISLATVLGSIDIDNFDMGDVDLTVIRAQLEPDSFGSPKSYLVSANFAVTLLKNSSVYVPSAVYANGLISVEESLNFTNALIAMQGQNSFNDWNVNEYMVLPDRAHRELMLNSLIMCATLSNHILTENDNVILSDSSVDASSTRVALEGISGQSLAIISPVQLEALFDIIESFGGSKLAIPDFDGIASIAALIDDLDLLYAFDVTRYRMSAVILNDADVPENYVDEDECILFDNVDGVIVCVPQKIKVLTREGIDVIINSYINSITYEESEHKSLY